MVKGASSKQPSSVVGKANPDSSAVSGVSGVSIVSHVSGLSNVKKGRSSEEGHSKVVAASDQDSPGDQNQIQAFLEQAGYRLDIKLGSGGFGKVYRAFRKDGEAVAVKVVRLSHRNVKESKVDIDFQRELFILADVKHPHIVKVESILRTRRKIYIFMEYCSGGEMHEYVNKCGRLTEKETLGFFAPCAYALHYMHYKGIAHRDFKLANVLIYKNDKNPKKGIPKVTDFGYSRYVQIDEEGNIVPHDTITGTVSYMAPEMLSKELADVRELRKAPYDPFKIDIWSLGIALFYMLFGQYPYHRKDPEMYEKQMKRERRTIPKVLDQLTLEVKELIEQLLEPDPAKRYTIDNVIDHPWMPSKARLPYKRLYNLSVKALERRQALSSAAEPGAGADESYPT